MIKPRVLEIPTGNYAFEEKLRNLEEPCSALCTEFQIGPVGLNHRLRLAAQLYEMCINELQFDFLRTKNQIGYISWAFWRSSYEVGSFKHVLQSSTFTCAAIEELLQVFLVEKV